MDLQKLKEPFENVKWRVQSFSKYKPLATCIPYIDARDVMNRLDQVVGAMNWQCDYKEVKGVMYCGIAINLYTEFDEQVREPYWIWKWDAGVESNVEKEKGEASDAFKRAFVKWGGARDLYEDNPVYIKANTKKESGNYPYCVDESGNKIYDLTDYINNKLQRYRGKPSWYGEAVKYLQTGGTVDAIIKKYPEAKKLKDQLMEDAI